MKIDNKLTKIFKVAAVYFMTSTIAGAGFVVGMIMLFVSIPPYLAVPIVAGIGWVVSICQIYQFLKKTLQDENIEKLWRQQENLKRDYQEMACLVYCMNRMAENVSAKAKSRAALERPEQFIDFTKIPLFFATLDNSEMNRNNYVTLSLIKRPRI